MKNLSPFEYIYDKDIPQLILEKRSCGGFRIYLEKELMEYHSNSLQILMTISTLHTQIHLSSSLIFDAA